ncbi:hypothetical protein SpCBS45565_g05171 [Spizellomyces sp. 'palustris']|nr:hypothetical protein SpCBS45565_g05171 [Spizellomyces sp. 'palustris']
MTTPLKSLTGKVALITGGSRGIGRAIAQRLAKDGATVIINYSSSAADAETLIKDIVDQIKPDVRPLAIKADVSKLDQCKALVQQSLQAFGRVDILVLNAGILPMEDLSQITEESFDRTFGVNVKGPMFLTQLLAPQMSSNSRVIFFSTSLTGASTVMPNYALYNSSKGAIEQLARVLAKDLGRRGINVNVVSPGPTATDMFYSGKTEEQVKFIANLSPFGRLGTPKEIAGVVAFLAGPDSAWVSGQNIKANGAFVV